MSDDLFDPTVMSLNTISDQKTEDRKLLIIRSELVSHEHAALIELADLGIKTLEAFANARAALTPDDFPVAAGMTKNEIERLAGMAREDARRAKALVDKIRQPPSGMS